MFEKMEIVQTREASVSRSDMSGSESQSYVTGMSRECHGNVMDETKYISNIMKFIAHVINHKMLCLSQKKRDIFRGTKYAGLC